LRRVTASSLLEECVVTPPLTLAVLEEWLEQILHLGKIGRRRAELARTAFRALRNGVTRSFKIDQPQLVFAVGQDPFSPAIRKALRDAYIETTLNAYAQRVSEIIRAWTVAEGDAVKCPDLHTRESRKPKTLVEHIERERLALPRAGVAKYEFPVRSDLRVIVEVPDGFTEAEAERMGRWLLTLVTA
jgi:hypothetical protein